MHAYSKKVLIKRKEGIGKMREQRILKLSHPRFTGSMSIEEAFKLRRTIRRFSSKEIDLSVISQLLWALQGITYVEDSPGEEKILQVCPVGREKLSIRGVCGFFNGSVSL